MAMRPKEGDELQVKILSTIYPFTIRDEKHIAGRKFTVEDAGRHGEEGVLFALEVVKDTGETFQPYLQLISGASWREFEKHWTELAVSS